MSARLRPGMLPGIGALRAALRRGELSHEAVVERALAGAAAPEAAHVFTRLYPEAALATARHADALQRAGVALAPLAGLPVSVKDLFDVAGETTLAGSVACQGEAPAADDALAVRRLRAQGAAVIGRTNMTEFAFSGVGINPHWGTPRNPADLQLARIPGGSSSGAAVSVALGLSVLGLGSDTGGSIRIPAALCGLVGFKSTQCRTPRQGAFELSRTLDTVCAMARDVDDCLLADAALADAPLAVARRPLAGLRLWVPTDLVLDDLEPAVAAAFARAVSTLSAAGALVKEQPCPALRTMAQVNRPAGFSPVEASAVHRLRLSERRAQYDPRVAARIDLGASVLASEYIAMLDARRDWISQMSQAMQGFDALLCPTVPMVAPSLDSLASDEAFFRTNGLLLRNTFVANFLDGCSFSLPCHQAGELPVGLMLTACHGQDAALAAAALAVETALHTLRQTD